MKVFDYEDIQLIPNKCIVNSRSECNTTRKMVISISCIGLMKQLEFRLSKK